jgi:hypothetical protein
MPTPATLVAIPPIDYCASRATSDQRLNHSRLGERDIGCGRVKAEIDLLKFERSVDLAQSVRRPILPSVGME